jgi:hypothetical protein
LVHIANKSINKDVNRGDIAQETLRKDVNTTTLKSMVTVLLVAQSVLTLQPRR